MKDFQKSRLYTWENVDILDGYYIPFDYLQYTVNAVWAIEGLRHPPRVEALAKSNLCVGKGNRISVWFRPDTDTSIKTLLHELAHSATADLHGPNFVGAYIHLVNRHHPLHTGHKALLTFRAQAYGLKVTEIDKIVL